ncbi:hypothetical protein [Pseudodesulfovibrio sp.]|uniref:L,D-transpeptidase family protein n=1 Tax=Pseudodesulfovibrio sp. TaxID=2035812 RepID=UPI002610DA84|nr:hypothetical protein [Pseudodesulfovibrio sp.]MDD3311164.1 hypothetical protein [Pseudodesulfovibrio sp.]
MPSRHILPALVLAALLATLAAVPAPAGAEGVPAWMASCRQLVVVTAPDWDSQAGSLSWYERRDGGPWRAAGGPVRADLGVHGLGWGVGLHGPDAALSGEPIKKEGDGKAPSGAFGLPLAFAYDPADLAGTGLPVMGVGPDLYCVDDVASNHYNSLVRLPGPGPKPWKSAETMLRPDGVYRIGLLVAHNLSRPAPGRGSCIFMHLLKPDDAPTSGCTALNGEALQKLILWLDPAARPVLVQLPEAAHARLRAPWALP